MMRALILIAVLGLAACSSNAPREPESVRDAERYLRSGVQAYGNADYAAAGALFAKSHALYRSIDHREGMVLTGINLAETAIAMGSYPRAERQVNAAAALAKSAGLEARFGARLTLLAATAAHGQGRTDEALAKLETLLPKFDADSPGTINGPTAVAAVILRTRIAFETNSDEALWTRRLQRVADKSGDDATRARLLRFQGQLAERNGDAVAALQHLDAALAIYHTAANRPGTAGTLNELGQLAAANQQWSDARDFYERALYIHTWILNTPGARDALHGLAAVHQATGQQPQAEAAKRWATSLTQGTEVNWRELRDQIIPTSQ